MEQEVPVAAHCVDIDLVIERGGQAKLNSAQMCAQARDLVVYLCGEARLRHFALNHRRQLWQRSSQRVAVFAAPLPVLFWTFRVQG